MEQNYCLNCSEEISKKFCSNCGQKTDTHRIKFSHFIMHDLLHGVWHLERGILFTLKETIVRPGQAALDYIKGKRIRYYNVFYLSLLAIGANIVLKHFFDNLHPEPENIVPNGLNIFLGHYLKIMIFCFVPLLALNAKLIFKRMELNIAEHAIISGFALLGMIVITLLYLTLDFLSWYGYNVIGILETISFIAILLFPAFTYSNVATKYYSFFGFLWRIIALNLMVSLQIMLALMCIASLVQGTSEITVKF